MTTIPSSSAKQAQEALGARLRELRKDAGLTGRTLSAATGQHFTRVSKIEHGVQTPSDEDIRGWCRACGADDQIPDLIATARAVESAYLEFRRQARAGMKRVLGPHTVALYARTELFRIYEHNVIPGLFQTAEYAAAMLTFWIKFLDTPNDLEAAVAARMERQRVIYQGRRRFAVVLEEQALRTWFGTAETQAGLEPAREATLVPLSTTTASIACVYDYLLGGKDNNAADRAAAGRILETFPEAGQIARANRAFQARAIRHAARQGIGQFLDLGAGLPASPSTHEAARQLCPAARVVYVDCDELVLAHARALLAVDEQIAVVGG